MKEQKQQVILRDLGRITFAEAWKTQTQILEEARSRKVSAMRANQSYTPFHHLLICEHDPVYTLGKSGKESHVLISEADRKEKNIAFFKINRGGDITYHGPGQLTVYPILDLDFYYHDIHRYVRNLEEIVIRVLATYGLSGYRIKEHTGVWMADGKLQAKICAIGVHMSRWISMHGLAFNITTDLSYFDNIIPCGINEDDKTVTSLAQMLSEQISMDEAKQKLLNEFRNVFNCELINA